MDSKKDQQSLLDVLVEVPEEFVKAERSKAKELRKSRWWQNKIANATCYYCGKKIPKSEVNMDHVVPISRGGQSVKSNIVTSCKTCNSTKKDHLLIDQPSLIDTSDK